MRRCAGCGHRASVHARFCERCGAALRPSARPLRAPSTLEARILKERTAIEGERKQVTVMYADIVSSMELTRALEAERWGFVLDRFLAIAAGAVHAFEGTVNQFTGDGLLAVFGAPLAHEDHARRACLAVLELQREVAALAGELEQRDGVSFAIRCGLNSGEVVVGSIGDDVHMDFVPVGNTTALGKRIEGLAPVGSTAISTSTAALVEGEFELRDLGEFEVKGVQGPQRLLELVGRGPARTRLEAVAATRGLSGFVGREPERAALESALAHALAGNGRAVGIVGDPGVGKSRLVHEFAAGCGARGMIVNSTAGVAHGRYVPLLPVLALYRDIFGVGESDAPDAVRGRITAAMLDLDPAYAVDLPLLFEFLGIAEGEQPLRPLNPAERQRRLLELLLRALDLPSTHEAAVLVIEDLHWFDETSAAFLGALVAALAGTRIFLIATYRPEHEAAWAGIAPHAQIDLGPLTPHASSELLAQLLGRDDSLEGLEARIGARTSGNPFFIEEIVHALAEDGHLVGGRGEYALASDLDVVALPATVQAGLADRIDRLPAREKALVQTMAVIGHEIPAPLLSEVSDLNAVELTAAVEVLAGARWLVPHDAEAGREYVFRHPLTQEVAYWSQLSERRARAHRTVAAAIERIYPDGLDERAALLAHHGEAAGDTLAGAGWHARAALWAELRSPADSMRHWRRVRRLTDKLDASPERDALATKARIGMLGLAWRLGSSPEETVTLHAEAHADVERTRLDLNYAGNLMHSGREREALDGFREVSRLVVVAGDRGAALTASIGVGYASWIAGSVREAVEAIDLGRQLGGDDPMTGSGLVFVCPGAFALAERGPFAGYMGEFEAARRDAARAIELAHEYGDLEAETTAQANLALLQAQVGQIEAATDNAARALLSAERTGHVIAVVNASTAAAVAEAGAGRFVESLARAESNLATIRQQGIGLFFEPLLLATIARSKLELGDPAGARDSAEEAVTIMDARGLTTCALAAPIALAQILIATEGAAARIDKVLTRASRVARESGARVFEILIDRELGRLRAGNV